MKTPETLITEVASRFLVENPRAKKGYRDRGTAAKIAREQVRRVLNHHFTPSEAQHLLMSHGELEGKNRLHVFDAVIQNGAPHFAVDALSFELPRASNLDLQIDAKAWALVDVRDRNPQLPIGIFTLPPDRRSHLTDLYEETVRTYTNIGVDVLTDETFTAWSEKMVTRILADR